MMNYDFKVFWKGRLTYLHQFLASNNINFQAIELFGKGSPYGFDSAHTTVDDWWTCLFPDNSADEIEITKMKRVLFEHLDRMNPDVIIASSVAFFAGALGMRWAKKNKKKFIMFENAKPSQFKRNVFVQKVKDTLIEQSDGIWLPSNDYDREYPNLRVKNLHFFYGYCCVDNDLFKIDQQNNLDHNTILCIARLVPIKNIEGLLRSWQIVEQQNPTCELKIIGDGPEFEKLNSLKNQLGLKKVEFLGSIDNQLIPPYFYYADAFILPSLSETWGLVVNEAMAAGLPIILSNKINAAHTLLKEGINGFYFDPLNNKQMADAILRFNSLSPKQKKAMSACSLDYIREMDYSNMGNNLVKALIKIKAAPYKAPGPIASLIISFWDGRYSTFSWNKL
ncbi:MAG: glycosyltransferase family 4 protein [Bacteroidia bacterium]